MDGFALQIKWQLGLFLGGFRLLHLLEGEREKREGHDKQEGRDEDQRPVLIDILFDQDDQRPAADDQHEEHRQEGEEDGPFRAHQPERDGEKCQSRK